MQTEQNYWKRSSLTRRRLLAGAGAAAAGTAGFGLVGCGDDAKPASTPAGGGGASPSAGAASPSAAATTPAAQPQTGSYLHTTGATTTFQTEDAHRELFPNVSSYLSYAYSHLIVYDDADKGTITGDLATGVPEQPDKQTYVFTLRPGIKWQNKAPLNGRDFTIQDLVFNFERQMAAKDFSGKDVKDFYRNSSIYKFVDKVEATDSSHLKVTLKDPRAIWLDTMCQEQNLLMSKEAAEKIEPNLNKPDVSLIVGTGPYIFTQFDLGKRLVAERNPDWWGYKAGLKFGFADKIAQSDLGLDINAQRAAFEQKQTDDFQSPDLTVIKDIQKATKSVLIATPDPNTNFTLAASMINPPFKDNMQLRQAIHLAIDRQQVIDLIFQGQGRAESVVPSPYVDWALPPDELAKTPGYRTPKDQDIKDARAMWAAAGGPALGEITLKLNEVATWQQGSVHEWFPAMLNKNLGTSQFKGVYFPTASVLSHIAGPAFDTLLCNWVIWQSPDPRARMFEDFTPKGALNFPRFDNAEITKLATDALNEFDINKAKELVKQAQRKANDMAGAGKFHMASGVRNFLQQTYYKRDRKFIAYDGIQIQRAWVDQKDPNFASRPKQI